jgi:His/Glu/Gln/Arg/opine family amino acid ABC transporter permease subunit
MSDVPITDVMLDDAAPESPVLSVRLWARENLFSSRANGFLTLLALGIILFVVRNLVSWIFATNRGWEAVATNLRLYMVQAYPADQFTRVWVSVGLVLGLVGLSLAIWKVGSRVSAHMFFKTLRSAGGILAMLAFLGPPTRDLNLLATADIPVVGFLLRIVGSSVSFVVESLLMTGGRLIVFLIGALIAVGSHIAARKTKNSEAGFHSLFIPLGAGIAAVVAMWVVPFGHYFFNNGEPVLANGELCSGACFDPGTIATTTSMPWTVLLAVSVGLYFLARMLMRTGAAKALRAVTILGWALALPVITLFILRDPDFNPAKEGGGIDFLSGTDVMMWVVFAVIGAGVLGVLSLPKLGEAGRAISGLFVVAAIAMWAVPMLMRVRFLGLLFAVFAVGAQTFAGDRDARIRYLGLWVGFITVIIIFFGAINVPSSLFVQGKSFLGGLTLTFVLALTSILLSVPIGVLMALGRTSTMPIFRVVSTVYIELVRGIPFITVLIFFDLILVLFLPGNVEFDSVMLAILGGTLFSAAYLAENVRGGLQSIPKGQYEAAKAMGLSTLQLTVFIVLPQALRAVIPALVGQTIAIFKDTSLVAIIGLFDFLFIADKVIPAQTIFLGIKLENIVFIAAVYWMFTFSFSRASLRLEKKVGLGER